MDELAALRLQMEWGADEALLDAPVDRTRPAPVAASAGRRPPAAAAAAPAAPSPAPSAAPSAAPPASLEELRAAIAAFEGCALRATAGALVFAEGDPRAALMIVADAPGADDDRAGRPLAGPDGAYLDRMLASIGLSRAQVLLTPLVPWRPPGGRPPSPAEIAQCLPFLHRLIALAQPRMLALAGPLAARALLGAERARPRGWADARVPGLDAPVPAVAFAAPAQAMRTPARRREAWAELRRIRRALDGG